MGSYQRIITHDDFDGIASAAICAFALKISHYVFTGPRAIHEARIPITDRDVICDLPYPLSCGLWFDHHEGNGEELHHRGIDIKSINGYFAIQPSCCRVVYEYFMERYSLPMYFQKLVTEADIIDAFDYQSVEDWRRETPGKIIDSTLKLRGNDIRERRAYMTDLVNALQSEDIDKVVRYSNVQNRYRQYRDLESAMLILIKRDAEFIEEDRERELIVLDFTKYKRSPQIVKNLAYLIYLDAKGVIEIKNIFQRDVKTNNLNFSMSLSLNLNHLDHHKDVGDIFRQLNIGDGHKGAGAARVDCASKEIMLKQKEEMLKRIFQIWRNQ